MFPCTGFAHGDLHMRIAAVTEQIEKATNNAVLYLTRGELHREHLDWKAAVADYDRAAQLDPKLATVDLCRAKMFADSGQLADSRATFDRYLKRCPADGRAFIERARLMEQSGERKAAVADYTHGIELVREPEPEYFLERAQVLVADSRTEEALHGLDEGIKKLGPLVTLQLFALDLEVGRKNFDAALARLDTIVSRATRKENWLARRGEIELLAGRSAEAQKSFEAALAAVAALPARLQQSETMTDLKQRMKTALAGLTNAPVHPTTDAVK